MRRVLWATVVYNLGGAFLFAFPDSSLGQLAGIPSGAPPVYRALLAFFVLLFAAAYAWLARQRQINRALVALAAIGKAGAFAIIFICWICGAASTMGILAATGDLMFAIYFAWWLVSEDELS